MDCAVPSPPRFAVRDQVRDSSRPFFILRPLRPAYTARYLLWLRPDSGPASGYAYRSRTAPAAWAALRLFDRSFQCGCDQRHHDFVVAGKSNRLAGTLRRALQDILSRPVMLNEVEVRRRELLEAMSQVANHRHGL